MNEEQEAKTPTISLIMALKDEAQHLTTTLAALSAQTLPTADWELVVAVAESADGTAEVLAETLSQLSGMPKVTQLENPAGSAAAGLNLAIAAARGTYIVRLDGHTELAPDYLEKALARLQEGLYDCVGGAQVAEGRGPWGRAYGRASTTLAGSGGAAYRRAKKSGSCDTVYLGAWPRRVLVRAGGFDESLERNQDDELSMRLREQGGIIYLDLEMQSVYRPRETLVGIMKQYFHYGYWKPRVLRRHPYSLSPRHLLPALWFLGVMGNFALILTTLSWGPLLYFVVWMFIAWLMVQPLPERAEPMQVLRTMILITLMPFAYGAGFILGAPLAFGMGPRLGQFEEPAA